MNKAQLLKTLNEKLSVWEDVQLEDKSADYTLTESMHVRVDTKIHTFKQVIELTQQLEELDIRTVLEQLEDIAKSLKPDRTERVFFSAVIQEFKEKLDEKAK